MTVALHGERAVGPEGAHARAVTGLLRALRLHAPPKGPILPLPLTPRATAWLTGAGLTPARAGPPPVAWRDRTGAGGTCELPRAWLGATALLAADADFAWGRHGLVGPATRALAALPAATRPRPGAPTGDHLRDREPGAGAALLDQGFAATLLLLDARTLAVRGLAAPAATPGLVLGAVLPRPTLAAAAALDHALAHRYLPTLAAASPPPPGLPPVRAFLPPRRPGARLLLAPPSALDRHLDGLRPPSGRP